MRYEPNALYETGVLCDHTAYCSIPDSHFTTPDHKKNNSNADKYLCYLKFMSGSNQWLP